MTNTKKNYSKLGLCYRRNRRARLIVCVEKHI